jgi:hypothetical protein
VEHKRSDAGAAACISAEALAQLAECGGLCAECGGAHVQNIEIAILLVNAARESGVTMPTCRCSSCRACAQFRSAVREVLSVAHAQRTWTSE